MGGLGISRATDIADIAFVSSTGSSWAIQPQLEVRHGYEQARASMESLGISVPPLPAKITSLVSPLINQTKEFKQSAFLVAASTSRRNVILNCDGIFTQLKHARINCTKEGFENSESQRRPGDIFIPDFDVYGDAFLDVSVISTVAPAFLSRSLRGQLEGSKIRFEVKKHKYHNLGNQFKHLVVECFGGWHPYSMEYLKIMANTISARSLKSPAEALNNILSTASIRLQKHQGLKLVRRW